MSAAAKNHPVGAYIGIVVISVILGQLFGLFNKSEEFPDRGMLVSIISTVIFLVWGIVSLLLFGGKPESQDTAH